MVNKNSKITSSLGGISAWLNQRITAIIMLIFFIYFLYFIFNLALNVDSNITSWQLIFTSVLNKIFIQIFILAVLLHALVGIHDVILDYIQCNFKKIILNTMLYLWLIANLIYSIKILWL